MNSADCQQPFSQRLMERIAASRFLTFSLMLHIVLVVLGGSVVLFEQMKPKPDFESMSTAPVTTEVIHYDDTFLRPTGCTIPASDLTPTATFTPPPTAISTIATNSSRIDLASLPQTFNANSAKSADLANLLKHPTTTTVKMPGAFAGRFAGLGRDGAMRDTGMNKKSELAVLAGLRWLRDHQNADGSWSDEYKPAMTGLALLSFLGHGELTTSPDFGPTVKKALDWVLERGTEFQGRMSLTKDGWGSNHGVYEHAIVTYAMGEYFAMTGDAHFEPLLRQAVAYIVDGQNPFGGWDYGYAKGPRNDLSVAGWQIQALKAAHLTGLGIAGVDAALDKSMGFIKAWQGGEGGFGYDKAEDRLSLTGVGVLCTYFWKQEKNDVVRNGVNFLRAKADVKYKGDKADLYGWYYDTQACLMFGDPVWSKWRRMFQDEIADSQTSDGSWPPTQGGVAGLQAKPSGCGPCYRTTLCVLMLEAFYRYAPSSR